VYRDAVVAALVDGDPRNNLYALDQQVLQPVVNLIDTPA
jgi:hypothetical protein